MVAKINKGSSLYGALSYNQEKVDNGTANIIYGKRIMNVFNNPDIQQTLNSFDNYLLANKKTVKPIVHISLNPDPKDNLTDEQFAELAKDYMEKMNYGNQPYIVYKHEDIDRKHIHIVSVCVDETGKRLSDSYEHKRSMDVCRELEMKYGLKNVSKQKNYENDPYLKKIDIEKGDVKTQIHNLLKCVTSYHYQTFGEYNALLSSFNVEAKLVKGEHKGKPFNGIIYSVTDDKRNVIGTPLKSSLFGKSYGFEALEKRMKSCAENFKTGKVTPKFKNTVAQAMKTSSTIPQFTNRLKKENIDVLFRQNQENRIYGVTFIDHNEQAVFNGSRLGKEFSANVFNSLFNEQGNIKEKSNYENFNTNDFIERESLLDKNTGLFAFEQHGIDQEEEEFARRMNKKKKKQIKHKF